MERKEIKEFLGGLIPIRKAGHLCMRCGHQFAPGERLIVRARVSIALAPGKVILRELCIPCHGGMTN